MPWPVQFIVSTHSSHVANAAGFESIRYFLPTSAANGVRQTKVKDLHEGMRETPEEHRRFLHQYLTDRFGHWDEDPAPKSDGDPEILEFMRAAHTRYHDPSVAQEAADDG